MMHHLIYAAILGHQSQPGVVLAKPIKNETPYSVLDIGTGSGIWACDISARFPGAEVYRVVYEST